ncbi:Required for respiratory growth protein 9 mitochondrial [Ascosphaera pollenicola]|nr:Required for respiratory growth protein 9 mitochondrial [Ascosphaera pollenicola]
MSGARGALKFLPSLFTASTSLSRDQLALRIRPSHIKAAATSSQLRLFSLSSRQAIQIPTSTQPLRDTSSEAEQQARQRQLSDDDYIPWEFEVPVEDVEEVGPTQESILADHSLPQDPEKAIAELQAALRASQAREAAEQQAQNEPPKKKMPDWKTHREALKRKFPEGWQPRKKVSPDTMELIRAMHHADPVTYSTPNLADEFKMSPEAVRRILKSHWRPTAEEAEERRERWEKREARIWAHMAELGLRPKRKDTEPFSDSVRLLEKKKKVSD